MNNNDYNNYMLNLYRECTFKISRDRNLEPHYSVQRYFEQAASSFNQNIAVEYLHRLNFKNYDLIQKMESYPYMFWKTPESTMQISKGLEKLHEKYIKKIDEVITLAQSPNKNSFYIETEVIDKANNLLNGELGDYDNTCGPGVFKEFSKDMLKIHLGLGKHTSVINPIEQFFSTAYGKFNEAGLEVDFSTFSQYLSKIFKNTNISEDIDKIDFSLLPQQKKEINTKPKI